MKTEDQKELKAFLSKPETYGKDVKEVHVLKTHCYYLFLTGDAAYKMKRAVRFPYLNYANMPLRREMAEKEVDINRVTVPGVYRGIEHVVRTKTGELSLGGEGKPVESLVVLRGFSPEHLLVEQIESGELERDNMYDLAEMITRYYQVADPVRDRFGSGALCAVIVENDEIMRRFVPRVFNAQSVKRYADASFAYFDRFRDLVDERRQDGKVRRCHGDLQLKNLVMMDGLPVPLHAIEFNDTLSYVDVLYDLAFLIMDMEAHDYRRFASILFNHYMQYAYDLGGVPLLPLFMACRAGISAHTNAQMSQLEPDNKRAEAYAETARQFLDLGIKFLEPPAPQLVASGGLSGSGKSRLSREIAPFIGGCPGATVLRTDVIRKRLVGVQPHVRLKKEHYGPEMNEKTYQALFDETRKILKTGHTVLADGIFADPYNRDRIENVAKEVGVPFQGFWMDAPLELRAERVASRKRNPSDVTNKVLMRQLDVDVGEVKWHKISSAGEREKTIEIARDVLGV